jgi:hypothetical protein
MNIRQVFLEFKHSLDEKSQSNLSWHGKSNHFKICKNYSFTLKVS